MFKKLEDKKTIPNFIFNTNKYFEKLIKKDYKNSEKQFESYITYINSLLITKRKLMKKENKKILENINDFEFFLKFHKEIVFENVDHNKDFCKLFTMLIYFCFNILTKMWKNEKILKKDVKNLTGKSIVFISMVILKKFNKLIDISNLDNFINDINNLEKYNIFKRKEEYIKFISRNFLKYLNTIFSGKEIKKFFIDKCGEKNFLFYFYLKKNKVFVKKFYPEIRFDFFKVQIFKEKFQEFKIVFKNKKSVYIDMFFFKLMTKKGKNYEKFKYSLKNNSTNHKKFENEDKKLINVNYPWTFKQIDDSFQFFECEDKIL